MMQVLMDVSIVVIGGYVVSFFIGYLLGHVVTAVKSFFN